MLMYPLGAQSVKCSVCHFVTNVCQPANWTPSSSTPQGGTHQRPPAAPKSLQTVVVENPPSLDEQGNEVGGLPSEHSVFCSGSPALTDT
jgi:LSD1 subclass zinc finger protein